MFNTKLAEAMTERGMNQKQLAESAGLSKAAISQYLAGKNHPNPQTLRKIADALEVDVAYFDQQPKPMKPFAPPIKLKNISVEEAARLLGKSSQFVRAGIQSGRLPIGTAVNISGKRWSYNIPPRRLETYLQGGLQA